MLVAPLISLVDRALLRPYHELIRPFVPARECLERADRLAVGGRRPVIEAGRHGAYYRMLDGARRFGAGSGCGIGSGCSRGRSCALDQQIGHQRGDDPFS